MIRRPRPFLILTLRRTGGTALTGVLSRASPFPAARHEPFNPDRDFGHLTRAYRQEGDETALREKLTEALERRPNLKHCVETVPPQITRALVETCAAKGYRLALLTRRAEGRRLRSLAIAQATGAWGPRQAERIFPEILAGRKAPRPIDLDALERAVRHDAAALGATLRLVRNRGLRHEWWVYEEIYGGPRPPVRAVSQIARRLGLRVSPRDTAIAPLTGGRVETEAVTPYLPDLPQAEALLARLVTD